MIPSISKTPRNIIAYINWNNETTGGPWAEFEKHVFEALNSKHFGDCTHEPCTCVHCYTNELFKEADELLEKMGTDFIQMLKAT